MLAYVNKEFEFRDGESKVVQLQSGAYLFPVTVKRVRDRLEFTYAFNKGIMAELKSSFEGIRYHGYDNENPRKIWTADYSMHNLFRLAFCCKLNPYEPYDQPLLPVKKNREQMMAHQLVFKAHALTRHYCVIAGEMGTGKTLAGIEVIEDSGIQNWIWVGPAAALNSVKLEFRDWKAKVMPRFISYSSLEKFVKDYPEDAAPPCVVFDESQNIKTPNSIRSRAAMALANKIRQVWGSKGYVILLSGTPAPKSPMDWYYQSATACPGFLKEGSYEKFRDRLAVVEQRENDKTGGSYNHHVAWRDSAEICKICGKDAKDYNHVSSPASNREAHNFVPGENEVYKLHQRLKGLVVVTMKKDCVDLPDKIYSVIKLEPKPDILKAAKLIPAVAGTAAKALILLRELSDGFQYAETKDGRKNCPTCRGIGEILHPVYIGPEITEAFLLSQGVPQEQIEMEGLSESLISSHDFYRNEFIKCPECDGEKLVDNLIRVANELPCPKEELMRNLLDEYTDVGRFVTFAGFTGSIDRCVRVAEESGWLPIRVDGRGWHSPISDNPVELLDRFKNDKSLERVCFIGHPASAGTGLNLTSSPVAFYWSNDFNGAGRMQSEDRIHRIGMNVNKGARIIDAIHLPVDQLIRDSLMKKVKLQSITLGQITDSLEGRVV